MVRKTNLPPRGLICPLVTPLKKGDAIDEAALDRLIEHTGRGADALLLGEPIWGEGHALSRDAKLTLFSTAMEIVQGRWPLLITVTDSRRDTARDLMAQVDAFADRLGYTSGLYWFDYPLYYHSNRGLPQWYQSLMQSTKHPLILGNHARLVEKRKHGITHNNIRTSVLKKMSLLDGMAGMVFIGSLRRSTNYLRAVRTKRDFRFYDGDEMTFITRPSSDGVMAGGANLVPNVWQDITRSCLNRLNPLREKPDRVNQLLAASEMLQEFMCVYEKNPAGMMKHMLHAAGILPHAGTASATRSPSAQHNRSVEKVLAKYDMI